jgi:NAD(P)-dependent dehydrogenase (short-subunit alcohol dehydrogenase family)
MATEKKVAFITGGNRGIGFETARQLAQTGVEVVIGARNPEQGKVAAEKLKAEGLHVEAIRFDITKSADYKEAYDYFDKKYGKLDILINNAGVWTEGKIGSPNNASTVTQATLREIFDTNFFGTIELTQILLPLIKKAPEGRIVNLSSILASLTLHADPNSPIYGAKALAYDASKAALNAFTVHLAAELRDTNVKVNSAHPGWVKTDMGTDAAPMEIPDGAKTSVQLATLAADGPTGGYFHMGEALPW